MTEPPPPPAVVPDAAVSLDKPVDDAPPPLPPPPPPPLLPPRAAPPAPPPAGPPARLSGLRALLLVIGGMAVAVFIFAGTFQIIGGLTQQDVDTPLSFPAGVSRVVIAVDAGTIEVRGGPRDTVEGDRRVTSGFDRPVITETRVGDTLRLTARCPRYFVHTCSVAYTLDVPRSVSVDVHSDAGRVTVEGIDGEVKARSDAGTVSAADIGGPVDLSSAAGRIEGTDLRGPTATAESSAGRVSLAFTAAPTDVTARSSAGGVEIEVPADGSTYRVAADSSVSEPDVQVATSPDADRSITAVTSAGGVSVTYAQP
jgi:hypothetical protein